MRAHLVTLSVLAVAALLADGVAAAGGGVVALQTADPSCANFSSGEIYAPCGNGTVTDNRTGLVWLANASCFGQLSFSEAVEAVAGLSDLPEGACGRAVDPDDCDCGLSDGSSAGEWRLPTLAEWQEMVAGAAAMGCSPTIKNDLGTACWSEICHDVGLCSFHGVEEQGYWSSSPETSRAGHLAWGMDLAVGSADWEDTLDSFYPWPVRGGQ